jgi:hypothetical protein
MRRRKCAREFKLEADHACRKPLKTRDVQAATPGIVILSTMKCGAVVSARKEGYRAPQKVLNVYRGN